ncbi:MAG: hypothetical protein DRG78_16330 [Epsilonproteobacteria bacterium]|nr:MAG: hypothetical protein DRG78_16330 [Campylobacterota bacterium]
MLIICPDCKKEFSEDADKCIHCGKPNIAIKDEKAKGGIFSQIAVVGFLIMVFVIATDSNTVVVGLSRDEILSIMLIGTTFPMFWYDKTNTAIAVLSAWIFWGIIVGVSLIPIYN